MLLANCYAINAYYIQSFDNLSSPTELSLSNYPESHYAHKHNPSALFDYAIGNHKNHPIVQQKQLLLDHTHNVSSDRFDDCVQKQLQQQQQRMLLQMENISSTTMSPVENAQQLEQFIMSLNLNNLTEFDQQPRSLLSSNIDKFTVDNEVEREEFEPEIENKIKHPSSVPFQSRVSIPKHIKAAVVTRYSMEYRPVNPNLLVMPGVPDEDEEEGINGFPQARIIEVAPRERPLQIHFKSPSNKIKVIQIPIKREQKLEPIIEHTEDEPRKFFHQIKKPIIQEVHEIIMPYRKVIQEIQPVVEQIHTVVSSASGSKIVSPKSRANKLLNSQHMNKLDILEQQNLLSSKVPFQAQQLEQEFEDATLSPALIGVEQQVDPLQESNIATTSMPKLGSDLKKHYLNIIPIMSSSLSLTRSVTNNHRHQENVQKYSQHIRLPKTSIAPRTATKMSKISSTKLLEQSKRHFS